MQSSTLAPGDTPANPVRAQAARATPERHDPGVSIPTPPVPAAPPEPGLEPRRFDVVRYRHNGRVQTGTVIRSDGERVWLKTGAATLDVALGSVVSLVRPSPGR